MDQQAALTLIKESLEKVLKEPVDITLDTDLVEDGILDSLDGMVFAMEVETGSGRSFPQDEDLVEAGYYKIGKLVEFLTA